MKIVFNKANFMNMGLYGEGSEQLGRLSENDFYIFDYPLTVSRKRYREFSVFKGRLVYLKKSMFTRWLVRKKVNFNYVIDPVSNIDCIPIPINYEGVPAVPDPENWVYIEGVDYKHLRHAVLDSDLDSYKTHVRSVLTSLTRRYFNRNLDSETLKVFRLQKMNILTQEVLNEYLQLCSIHDAIRLKHSYLVDSIPNMNSSEQIDWYMRYFRTIISSYWKGGWSVGNNYVFGDIVDYDGKQYKCKSSHISSEEEIPDQSGMWEYLLDVPSFG